MTDNMFDKFVREKLKDHQSAVPAGLWEKIEQRKDKGRRGGFLPKTALWTGLFFLVTFAGIGYIILRDNDEKTVSQVSQTSTNENLKSSNKSNNLTGKTTPAHIDNINSATDDKIENVHVKASSGLNTASINTNTASPNAEVEIGKLNTPDITYANNDLSVTSKKKNKKRLFEIAGKKHYQDNGYLTQQNNVETVMPNELQKSYVPFTHGKTAYNLTNIGKFDADKSYSLSELKIVGIDCPPNGRSKRNDWYLEVYGSPDLALKSVKATSNAGYVSKKDSSETQQLSYTAGFRISRSIGNNLLIKTGLQYSQINERFDLRTENERRITTVITIRTIIGQGGVDSTVRDTTSMEQIGYRVQRTYNKYRSLDIPILLSYEFGNENLKFAVNAGAIINLHSWYSGNTLNDSLAVVSINSKTSGMYKENIGVGLYAGFSVIKPVSKRFDVFLEPYFRYNFTNMSRSSGYSQRFNAAGISFGIRYRINKQRSGTN
jgi:hypothetical protein